MCYNKNVMVVIQSYKTRIEAEIAKGFLQANNIAAEVTADDGGECMSFPCNILLELTYLLKRTIKKKQVRY